MITYVLSIADEDIRRRRQTDMRWYHTPNRRGTASQPPCGGSVARSQPSRFLSSFNDIARAPPGESAALSVNGVDGDATAPGPPPPLVTEEGEPYLSEIITYMRQSIRFRKRVPLKDVMAAMQNLRAAAESKKQVVGPSAAGLLLKCTGKL